MSREIFQGVSKVKPGEAPTREDLAAVYDNRKWSRGVDCASPITAEVAAELVRQGVGFVMRYVEPASWDSWKALTPAERDIIHAHGLAIGLVFELTGSASELAKDGVADGQAALLALRQLEVPKNCVVYFAVDYQAPASDMPIIENYLRQAQSELGSEYEAGVYGSYDVVEAMSCGVVKHTWQTVGWSRGLISKHIDLYQYSVGDSTSYTIGVDHDESYGTEVLWTADGLIGPMPVASDRREAQGVTTDASGKMVSISHSPPKLIPPVRVDGPSADLLELHSQLEDLRNQVALLDRKLAESMLLDSIPDWAVQAVDWAVASGLISNRVGTLDFYRMVSTLYNFSLGLGKGASG